VRLEEGFRVLTFDEEGGWRFWLSGHRDGLELNGRAWGNAWDPPPVRLYSDHDRESPEADFSGVVPVSEGAFAVRPEAFRHQDLEMFLGLAGELLPLPYDGREFKLLNVTDCVDALDWDQTIKKATGIEGAGYPRSTNIDQPRFHLDRLRGQIFKIPEHATSTIYYWERSTDDPSEQFRRSCERTGLTGLRFQPIYSTPADEPPEPAPLPLPIELDGPIRPFREAVDNYVATHSVTRNETFDRISRQTGLNPKDIALRYYQRGDEKWVHAQLV